MHMELQRSAEEVDRLRAERLVLLDKIESDAQCDDPQHRIMVLEEALRLEVQKGAAAIEEVRSELQASQIRVEAMRQAVEAKEVERCVLAKQFEKSRAVLEAGAAAHQAIVSSGEKQRDLQNQASDVLCEESHHQAKALEETMRLEAQQSTVALDEGRSQLRVSQMQVEALQQAVAAKEEERRVLAEQLEKSRMAVEEGVAAHQSIIGTAEQERDVERHRIAEAESQCQVSQRQLQAAEQERSAMRLELQKGACAKRLVKVLEKDRDVRRLEHQDLQAQHEKAQHSIVSLERGRDDALGQLDAQRETSLELAAKCQASERQAWSWQDEQIALRQQAQASVAELEESWRQVKALQDERAALRLHLQRAAPAVSELEESQHQVQALQEERAALRQLFEEKGMQAAAVSEAERRTHFDGQLQQGKANCVVR